MSNKNGKGQELHTFRIDLSEGFPKELEKVFTTEKDRALLEAHLKNKSTTKFLGKPVSVKDVQDVISALKIEYGVNAEIQEIPAGESVLKQKYALHCTAPSESKNLLDMRELTMKVITSSHFGFHVSNMGLLSLSLDEYVPRSEHEQQKRQIGKLEQKINETRIEADRALSGTVKLVELEKSRYKQLEESAVQLKSNNDELQRYIESKKADWELADSCNADYHRLQKQLAEKEGQIRDDKRAYQENIGAFIQSIRELDEKSELEKQRAKSLEQAFEEFKKNVENGKKSMSEAERNLLREYQALGAPAVIVRKLSNTEQLIKDVAGLSRELTDKTIEAAQRGNTEIRSKDATRQLGVSLKRAEEELRKHNQDYRAKESECESLRDKVLELEESCKSKAGEFLQIREENANYKGKNEELEQSLSAMRETQMKLEKANAEAINHIRGEISSELSLIDLNVLTAQKQSGGNYQKAASVYDSLFPEGITSEVRQVIEDGKAPAWDDEMERKIRELEGAGVNIVRNGESDLELIAKEVQGFAIPFESTEDGMASDADYHAALGTISAYSKSPKLNPEQQRRKEEAEKEKGRIENLRSSWEQRNEKILGLVETIRGRAEKAEESRKMYEGKLDGAEIPLVYFVNSNSDNVGMQLIIPCDDKSQKSKFTSAVEGAVAHAIKGGIDEVFGGSEGVGVEGFYYHPKFGASILDLTFRKGAKAEDVKQLMGLVGSNLEGYYLSKMGVRWRPYLNGESIK